MTGSRKAFRAFVLVLLAGSAGRAARGQLCDSSAWRPERLAPAPRSYSPFAFDEHRGTLILFSGIDGSTRYPDTWEYNLEQRAWQERTSATQPARRDSHSLVYDPGTRRVLLFGGDTTFGGGTNETWEWDGDTGVWVRLATTYQPSPRQGSSMFFCPERNRILLYGGWYNGTLYNDLWEWDRASLTWGPVPLAIPGPLLSFTGMAREPQRGVYLLFGGIPPSGPSVDETWALDPLTANWVHLNPVHHPQARSSPVIVTDPASQRVVLFGGGRGIEPYQFADTWGWNADAQDWEEMATQYTPPARSSAAGAVDTAHHELVIFGGDDNLIGVPTQHRRSDTWALGLESGVWTQLESSQPNGSGGMQVAYDPLLGCVVVYAAGFGRRTWELSGDGWRETYGFEPQINNAAVAFDGSRVILFGADQVSPGSAALTWGWVDGSWIPLSSSGPAARSGYAMAYDNTRRRVILFGGMTSSGFARDTWEWNGSTWMLVNTEAPLVRNGHSMAFDPNLDVTLVYGGTCGANCFPTDTWAWNGDTWMRFTTPGPFSYTVYMAFDPAVGRVVMGGSPSLSNPVNSTYEWEGSAWQPGPPSSAPIGGPGPLAYDSRRQRLLHFAGADHNIRGCSCYPNCDVSTLSPVLNVADFVCFLNRFAASDPYANCDGSSVSPTLNVNDFVCFLERYSHGCP